MTADFVIDEMTEDDLDEVLEIEQASFPFPWSRELFKKEFENSHSFNYVVRNEARGARGIVGYIVFWKVADEIHILDLAVHDGFRRRGLGRKLLLKAFCEASKMGCSFAILEVRENNVEGAGLYSSFGFKEIGLRKGYYKNGEDAIVMGLELKEAPLG